MTTVTLELPDQLVQAVQKQALDRGVTLSQQVSDLLEESSLGSRECSRMDAIERMDQLFKQVQGFQVEPNMTREELHDRERLR